MAGNAAVLASRVWLHSPGLATRRDPSNKKGATVKCFSKGCEEEATPGMGVYCERCYQEIYSMNEHRNENPWMAIAVLLMSCAAVVAFVYVLKWLAWK